ncbi:hypothetical protein ScPMuIL_003936 [Solemya velum]
MLTGRFIDCFNILFFMGILAVCLGQEDCSSNTVQNDMTLDFNVSLSKEKLLIKALLCRYKRYGRVGRPVSNTTERITVEFGLSLIQILNVDEKNQVLETNVWFTYSWKDRLLVWEPARHDNVTTVMVPSEKIWQPDIVLYNFADPRLKEQRDALAVISCDGTVLWMPQAILRSSCQFETTYFPFDEQRCHLKFGSWTYDGNRIDLIFFQNRSQFDLTDFVMGTEWDINENEATRNEKFYQCCADTPYPDLTFRLRIRRKVAFYSFILLLPCALLSLLTLVIFWVPPESPAKLQLGMNIFVAFFVLLLLLSDSTPKAASTIPLIGAYFCLSMVMITFSTLLSTIIANMFFRGVRVNRAPKWMRRLLINGVARLLCIHHTLEHESDTPNTKNNWNSKVGEGNKTKFIDMESKLAKVRLLDNCNDKLPLSRSTDTFDQNNEEKYGILRSSLAEDIHVIREILEKYKEKKMQNELRDKSIREWRVICCVTDRLFFILYLAINITGILVIFLCQGMW